MKRTYLGLVILTCSIAMMAQSGSATPAAAPAASTTSTTSSAGTGPKVGIIDMQSAIIATNEGGRDFDALQKKFEPKRTELQNQNTEIENLKKQLNTQGDKMNDDARANLVKNIETKQKNLQRSAEDAQNEFTQQQNEIVGRILQKMAPVIDKYAKDNGFTLLLDSSNPWPQGPLLWANQGIDVTKPVVDAYNAQSGVAAPANKPAPTTGATTPRPTPSGATGSATKPPATATPPKQ